MEIEVVPDPEIEIDRVSLIDFDTLTVTETDFVATFGKIN
jgi:hypothetical protein